MRKLLLVMVLGMFGTTGCRDDCTPLETRCSGQLAQICGSDRNWETMQDCSQVGSGFACCLYPGDDGGTPAGHTCLPTCGGDQ
jgi:hypothetical protein